jgi:hypothetical protein
MALVGSGKALLASLLATLAITSWQAAPVYATTLHIVPPTRWVMIQGEVTAVHPNWVRLRTPPVFPCCRPHVMCPLVVAAGLPVRVGTRHARFQDAEGVPISEQFTVGMDVVVAGKETDANVVPIHVQAYLVETTESLPTRIGGCPLSPEQRSPSAPALTVRHMRA